MKPYGVNELRRMFLEFFESKEHLAMKSFSLVPHNDNSLLIINSGMAPLKPYFTGQEIPPRRRVTTCQKCIRTGDLDNVGKTARHLTFFEMLGNFSFGDYFKEEALTWSWEFLTEVVGLDKDRLYPSIYMEDDEAYRIWTEVIGVDPARITKFGRDSEGNCDNFWEHGAGPCGPCSEIYYDRGEKYESGVIEEIENAEGFLIGKDSDRYMEVWNDVFTQFDGDGKGGYEELKQKNIDTGMGLERLAAVVQDAESVFDIDTMKAIRDRICEIAHVEYEKDAQTDVSVRVIVDHMRSMTFMISDGIMPSNEGRGYVLRRIIRRAARHGRKLGITENFLADLSKTVIEGSKDGYPELEEKQDFIHNVLNEEESKFTATIDQGLSILNGLMDDMAAKGEKTLAGAEAFRLYDTFGFPLDLTKDILEEKGLSVDEDGFNAAMQEQKENARSRRKISNYMGADATVYDALDVAITSTFDGYDKLETTGKILALTTTEEVTQALSDGQDGTIITDITPFYGTMGGQLGDTGVITLGDASFTVKDTIHLKGGKIGHVGTMTKGMMKTGDTVTLTVDALSRKDTCKNHSATHLLHKALREVLGTHVEQAGSEVSRDRLRFDFSHFQAMTAEEIARVEQIVNEEIGNALPVETKIMTLDEAKATGAMALFGEKYGEEVRVVIMGDFSTELCGGTHVKNTGAIGSFKIVSENGIAAGVRRIEALTGNGVLKYYSDLEHTLAEAAKAAKSTPQDLVEKIAHLQSDLKALNAELNSLKSAGAKEALGNIEDRITEVNGMKLLAADIAGVDMNGLRDLGDQMKDKIGSGMVLLISEAEGKVNLIAMATDDAVARGAHAGNLIREIAPKVGGKGGGRPNMAQAGGKDASGIADAIAAARDVLAGMVK